MIADTRWSDRLRQEAKRVRLLALKARIRNVAYFLADTAREYEVMAELAENVRRMQERLSQNRSYSD